MTLDIATPALLFPAVSLLFLAYTNRFLHLSALVRNLHLDWTQNRDETLHSQIENLRKRLRLIRLMQLLGATSLLLCVISMVAVFFKQTAIGNYIFFAALTTMAASLWILIVEIWLSGGALEILLNCVEEDDENTPPKP